MFQANILSLKINYKSIYKIGCSIYFRKLLHKILFTDLTFYLKLGSDTFNLVDNGFDQIFHIFQAKVLLQVFYPSIISYNGTCSSTN